ncbi:MAG: hypothetical protein LBJ19_01000 [Holosporaceae bacterium]|jgi:hypothetical protein|nr:hypothetical protein [Holosporaceae bacterium]
MNLNRTVKMYRARKPDAEECLQEGNVIGKIRSSWNSDNSEKSEFDRQGSQHQWLQRLYFLNLCVHGSGEWRRIFDEKWEKGGDFRSKNRS